MQKVTLVDKAIERACHDGSVTQDEYDAWQSLKAVVLAQQTNNTAMVQLLYECKAFMSLRNSSDEEAAKFASVVGRVNAVIAQQHHS